MTRTFIQTKEFSRRRDDLGLLELDIMKNPKKYPVIKGTGRLRKGRVAFENRGKSGSARVCYVDFVITETIYLITVYAKDEKDNLSQQERNSIKKVIDEIEKSLGGGCDER